MRPTVRPEMPRADLPDNGRHFLHSLILDPIFPDNLLQVHESPWREIMMLLQTSYVIIDGSSDLYYISIGENGSQMPWDSS